MLSGENQVIKTFQKKKKSKILKNIGSFDKTLKESEY